MAKVENTGENFEKCHCVKCPTMNGCGRQKGERLFCARGKESCEYKTNGCVCGGCSVHGDNHLDSHYYCRAGSAEQIG